MIIPTTEQAMAMAALKEAREFQVLSFRLAKHRLEHTAENGCTQAEYDCLLAKCEEILIIIHEIDELQAEYIRLFGGLN